MSEVVALLLDDAMPPERLGALLRAARKRRGFTRKHAAAAAGTTAAKLRSFERGDQAVPAGVCARLAECYGEDLTAHVPLRVPPRIESSRITIGEERRSITDADDVLAAYVDIVHRLRDTAPGDPLALRTADIVALAGALGSDHAVIEQRIADVLGCSRAEAGRLHHELLRRKVILPVAGLAAGMAAFAGSAAVAQAGSSATNNPTPVVGATTASTTPPARPARVALKKTAQPASAPTTPTTAAPAPAVAPAPPGASVSHAQTDATVPPSQQQAEVPIATPPPQADPDDPPVSVLPGETPITIIIGTPDSAGPTP